MDGYGDLRRRGERGVEEPTGVCKSPQEKNQESWDTGAENYFRPGSVVGQGRVWRSWELSFRELEGKVTSTSTSQEVSQGSVTSNCDGTRLLTRSGLRREFRGPGPVDS